MPSTTTFAGFRWSRRGESCRSTRIARSSTARSRPDGALTPPTLRQTSLYDEHLRLGARMVVFAGWEMPIQYPTGIVAEHRATRQSAGLFDLSHMGELRVRGAHAAAALDRLISSDIAGLAVGRARYGM